MVPFKKGKKPIPIKKKAQNLIKSRKNGRIKVLRKIFMTKNILFFFTVLTLIQLADLTARNPRRLKDESIPSITAYSTDPCYNKTWPFLCTTYQQADQPYTLNHSYLRKKPIKTGFDYDYFNNHLIPEQSITFRNKTGAVSGQTLSKLAENLVLEIKQGKQEFSDFSILKDKDFNYQAFSGLLVLKYKAYPFVLKVSIEHPHTIIQPLSKSIEAYGIFVVGGNLRHLTNFSRIRNLEALRTQLSHNPFYIQYLDFPRKWYWKPKEDKDLTLVWNCNGTQEMINIPNVYGVISDFIETEPNQPQSDLNRLSMKVATDTGFAIDPHSGNIVIETGTHKYVLLDTEDFRMMVGLNDKSMKAKKYVGWYLELIGNSIKIMFFRTKKERLNQTLFD